MEDKEMRITPPKRIKPDKKVMPNSRYYKKRLRELRRRMARG